MPLPPASRRPLPRTLMRPSNVTVARRSAIVQICPGGWTPRTMLRLTTVAVAAVPCPDETGMTPIPPLNFTRVSSAAAWRTIPRQSTNAKMVFNMILPMPRASQARGATGKVGKAARRCDARRLRLLLLPSVSRRLATLLGKGLFPREADLPAAVDGDDLHQHLVAFLEHVLDLLHSRVGEVGDVHQTVSAGEDLDEGAELHDPAHRAEIGLPDLGFLGEGADHLDRLIDALARGGGDGDAAVVLDVDARAGAGDDVLDHLAARPDDVLDAGDGDADGGDLRRVLGDVGARRGDRLRHLGEDVEPAAASLLERVGEDLFVDARDLDVHLDGRDPLGGPANLEVHVAEVILVAEDVGEDGDLVILLDEAHGDAGNRSRDGDARVHQREAAAAHGRHGRRAVGLEDVAHNADRVRALV